LDYKYPKNFSPKTGNIKKRSGGGFPSFLSPNIERKCNKIEWVRVRFRLDSEGTTSRLGLKENKWKKLGNLCGKEAN